MKKYLMIIPVLMAAALYSCHLNDSVSSGPVNELTFNKIFTAEKDSVKFDVYSASGLQMYYGYNDIGFKLFVNGAEKKTGYVIYAPMMYHETGGPGHSSPVSQKYFYNTDYNLFKGYACFTMLSDSNAYWFGSYNYNDTLHVDSVYFQVAQGTGKQLSYWDDIYGGHTYCMTLIKPFSAVMNTNTFSVMLHRTNDDKHFTEVDSADMRLKVYFENNVEVSSGNVNPVWKGGGVYTGSINLTKTGRWHVQDTVYYRGNRITKTTPPEFLYTVY